MADYSGAYEKYDASMDTPRVQTSQATAPVQDYNKTLNAAQGVAGPDHVIVHIELKYDAKSRGLPFRYELTFPSQMKVYLGEAGYIEPYAVDYTGNSETYVTASEAQRRAEQEVIDVVKGYSKYTEGKKLAASYTVKVNY